MWNKFLITFLGSVLLISCGTNTEAERNVVANKQVNATTLRLEPNKGLVYMDSIAFSGNAVLYNKQDVLVQQTAYLHGKKHGVLSKWFEDGVLSYQANYENGKLEGEVLSFWSDGTKRSQANFLEGKVHGTQYQWYRNGQLFKELNYTLGKEDGMQKAWRENGALYNNYEMVNGRIFGMKRASLCYELEDETIKQ